MVVATHKELAWLEIDLDRLRKNIAEIRKNVGSQRKIMSIVKGNAYGLGSKEISSFLLENGVDEIGVANIDEAITLRVSGIDVPILILGVTLPEQASLIVKHDLTAAVCDMAVVRALNELGEQEKRRIKIHIRVDLGLGSVGLLPQDCVSFIEEAVQFKWVEIEGIFTQLASSYDEDMDEISKDIGIFNAIITDVQDKGISIPVVHIASSAAILTLPETYYDMVRAGMIMYGLPVLKNYRECRFKPIVELKAKVVVVKELEAGTLIGGYGDRTNLDKKTIVATIPVGYGDGLFLFYLKNGEVIIHGKKVPIIGKPFMDYLMVNVTDVPNVSVGDDVVIFGNQGHEMISVEEVAEKANIGSMNCDCITLLTDRLPRIYVSNQIDGQQAVEEYEYVLK